MARPASITQEDVESAVTALEANGKPINPYQEAPTYKTDFPKR